MQIERNTFSSKQEYDERLQIEPEVTKTTIKIYDETGNLTSTRIIEKEIQEGKFSELAYKEACENRRFEIGMYWKRATYFWAFIASIYTAFYFMSKNDCNFEYNDIAQLVLSFMGFAFCLGFYLANVGSKQWIDNWELHEGLLEDEFAGKLYKTYIYDDKKSYSVTKVNHLLNKMLIFVSAILFVVEYVEFINKSLVCCDFVLKFTFFVVSMLFIVAIIFYEVKTLLGNNKKTEKKKFKRVRYE